MQNGSKNILNDETLSKFKNMNDVESALPVISAVGKINFNNSVADVAVYGVTSDYLKKIDIKTTSGNIFDNNELTKIISAQNQEKTRIGEVLDDVKKESLIGDTVEANGLKYNEKGELVLANDADIIAEIKKVDLDGSEDRSAVVNQAMLQILGIQEVAAIGQKFTASFVMMGGSMGNHDEKIETTPSEYAIVGVIPEGKAAMLYMPFINLRSFGASNYAQIKVAVSNPKVLTKTRTQIEAMGYQTQSVADTVDQINNLFSTARMFLALVGMIALSVAALGMFNTLTVSLLERTREVGLMKAMGMKADEVRELFLTESMIMGFLGGALGIILGYVGGKVVGFALSFFSIMKGAGTISIASIPPILIFIIIALSLFVGIVTGIYPAKRAEKISALNALRYE
jgi:ABC-type antimicrobial peptide transport system permease subunit